MQEPFNRQAPPMSLSACQLKEEDWAEWGRLYRLPAFRGARLEEKLQAAMIAPKRPLPGDPFIARLKQLPVPEDAEQEGPRPAWLSAAANARELLRGMVLRMTVNFGEPEYFKILHIKQSPHEVWCLKLQKEEVGLPSSGALPSEIYLNTFEHQFSYRHNEIYESRRMPPAGMAGICVLPFSFFREPGIVVSDMGYLPLTDITGEAGRARAEPAADEEEAAPKKRARATKITP